MPGFDKDIPMKPKEDFISDLVQTDNIARLDDVIKHVKLSRKERKLLSILGKAGKACGFDLIFNVNYSTISDGGVDLMIKGGSLWDYNSVLSAYDCSTFNSSVAMILYRRGLPGMRLLEWGPAGTYVEAMKYLCSKSSSWQKSIVPHGMKIHIGNVLAQSKEDECVQKFFRRETILLEIDFPYSLKDSEEKKAENESMFKAVKYMHELGNYMRLD